jgi:transposase-like protein
MLIRWSASRRSRYTSASSRQRDGDQRPPLPRAAFLNRFISPTATGRPRNRSWPEALKRETVAASFAPGSSVSIVARQYDVNANQVFSWRKRYREEPRPPSDLSAPQLIPVMITAEEDGVAAQPSSMLPPSTVSASAAASMRKRLACYALGRFSVFEARKPCALASFSHM